MKGGVADRETVLELKLNTTGNRGGNSFALDSPGERIAVPCLPLDQILRNTGIDHVDSMKLDIEGFEYPVLKAFFEAAAQDVWPKAISIEVVPELVSTSGNVLQLLADRGYRQVGRVEDNFLLLREPPQSARPESHCDLSIDRADAPSMPAPRSSKAIERC